MNDLTDMVWHPVNMMRFMKGRRVAVLSANLLLVVRAQIRQILTTLILLIVLEVYFALHAIKD